jgi:opacity protein-like surface antigen
MRLSIAALILVLALPTLTRAQTTSQSRPRWEAAVTVGVARLWRKDRTYGKGVSIGGSVVFRTASGVAVAVGVDRTVGPASRPLAASVNLRYYWRQQERVQPYVTVGIGLLRVDATKLPITGGVKSTADVGFGPNLGAGLVTSVRSGVILTPDVQWQDGTWRSPMNVGLTRLTIGAGGGAK